MSRTEKRYARSGEKIELTNPYEATVEKGFDIGTVLIAEYVYEDGDVRASAYFFDPSEYEVLSLCMNQDKTEQFAYEPEKVKEILMDLVEDPRLTGLTLGNQKYVLADLLEAHEEIERLNAVIKEQQDGLKEIAKPYGGVSSPPALERRLIALKTLEKTGVQL